MLLWIHRFRLRGHHGRRSQKPTTVHPHSNHRVANDRFLRILRCFRSAHHCATILRTKCQSTVPTYVSHNRMGLGQVVRDNRSDQRTVRQVISRSLLRHSLEKILVTYDSLFQTKQMVLI